MSKTITITLTIDTEQKVIDAFDMTEGLYNRTEFIGVGDDPEIIDAVVDCIRRELKEM